MDACAHAEIPQLPLVIAVASSSKLGGTYLRTHKTRDRTAEEQNSGWSNCEQTRCEDGRAKHKYDFCCHRTEVEILFSKSRSVKSTIVTSDAEDICSSQMEDASCWKLKDSLHCTEPFHDPKHHLNGK